MDVVNILIVGVGGQGLLTLARLIVESANARGFDALAAETHGMSQRGGSVVVYVRVGKEVLAPTIPRGMAHLILSTELIETVRYIGYANWGTKVITNTKIIYPAIPGAIKYVDEREVISWLKDRVLHLYTIEASKIAEELGSPQSTNMVVLGASTIFLKDYLDLNYLEKLVGSIGRGRVAEANLQAYRRGREYMCKTYGCC